MREGIGSIFLYNIIIVFIVVIFAFLFGIVSYYKGYKVNSRIVGIIEKYEGYNDLSKAEIKRTLQTLGYTIDTKWSCPNRGSNRPLEFNGTHRYCVYYNSNGNYYSYGVTTYIIFSLPVIGAYLNLPVYTETSELYKF